MQPVCVVVLPRVHTRTRVLECSDVSLSVGGERPLLHAAERGGEGGLLVLGRVDVWTANIAGHAQQQACMQSRVIGPAELRHVYVCMCLWFAQTKRLPASVVALWATATAASTERQAAHIKAPSATTQAGSKHACVSMCCA